jgi:crotonobetainyl-CoA:carnitine CoA-transferase CaiB-like acyl-CoA transferase
MREWCAQRTQQQVLDEMAAADAAVGPIMTMEDIANDPHYAARNAIITVEGTPMQALIAQLSRTPGHVKWRGRPADFDGESIRRNGWGDSAD